MEIIEAFNAYFSLNSHITNDFSLVTCEKGVMIGLDKDSHIAVVIKSNNPRRFPIMQKTQKMSIECNIQVDYCVDNEKKQDMVHIIRCLSSAPYESKLFLELATMLIHEGDCSEEAILDTFNTLRSFFNNNKEIADIELIGLYAELYSICKYHDNLGLEKYWQSRDKMKFDFSITEKMKLEVKATTKNTRTHHFRHEQLMTELYDIYVLSYMLRYDDEGLSLYELINQSKQYLSSDSRKLIKIDLVLKNASEERLRNLKFNRDYTETNMRFYKASQIPKFREITPNGVANAEYDCVLDNTKYISEDEITKTITAALEAKNV